ncbi:uncharacterized protein BHQ10_008228 [Talaromyces amestolkiae]|uniref:Zn(2)-C6 fungal-type domain-containing protein n=1 Tax=Talaromyces amestolkiae TaxID=1196081 RepID=A0A364L8S8_TALAM|nr:uncharacterized protein BHQ10_008228 [Talaromyces amestolkiae]RAO72216.1 hypothetical protein BHQ10_008228 [Talaromyces amestolkiae]
MHVETTPESSTAPENVTTGTSSSPILPSSPGSQGPCMSVWYPAGGYPPVGRNRKRRKMNKDELVRNRALKAAGGACENCRRRKKKCHHKDNRLILSAPASTPTTTSASAPTQAQAPANTAPAPSHNVSPTYHRNLGPRSVVRPRPNDIRQGATFGQQQQHNPSIASSYGPSLDPSMFSSSDGGAFSNGTMTSAQSDAITLAADEYHPEMGAEARFGMNTAGFGHQFNGRLAPEFDPTNPNNQIGLLETWPNSARERTTDAGH